MAILTMARKELFQAVVDSLSADDLDDFLARLAGCEDEIAPAAVLPGCTVLLGLYPRLRSQSKVFLDVGPEFAVDRVVLQLLVAERDPLWLLATALAEDPGDRGDIDDLLQDDTAAAALLLSAAAQVRAREMGSVAVQTEQMLRRQFLGTVVGDDKAIATMVDRVAAARADDEAVMAVVVLARKYLAGWRPSEFPFGSSDPVIRQAVNHPNMIFSPSVISGGWPALLIRAVTTYEVDPAWAARADVSGAEFHHRLAAFLDGVPLAGQIATLAGARDLPADAVGWKPDPDAQQYRRVGRGHRSGHPGGARDHRRGSVRVRIPAVAAASGRRCPGCGAPPCPRARGG